MDTDRENENIINIEATEIIHQPEDESIIEPQQTEIEEQNLIPSPETNKKEKTKEEKQEERNDYSEYSTDKLSVIEKLKSLAQWNVIDRMIKENAPFGIIAKYVQDTLGEMKDVKYATIIKALNRYYHSIPETELVQYGRPSKNFMRAMKRYDEGMDELAGLWEMGDIQYNRTQMSLELEQTLGVPTDQGTKNVALMIMIFEKINDIKSRRLGDNFKYRKTGDEPTKTIDEVEDLKEKFRKKYGKAGELITDPNSRRRILNVIEKLDKCRGDKLVKLLACRKDVQNIGDVGLKKLKEEIKGEEK